MNIKNFVNTVNNLPPEIAVLMRGPTGIGKSALAKSAAEGFDLPFIDVRGSTMSEGDTGGYPDIEGMKTNGIMTFVMPAWFVRACSEPVLLFLDELNRSLPGVQQSFFQIVLDRELGNDITGMPYKLHPETRVYAAVNHGSEYDVNDMDPALLRRFWVCDIENTKSDWINWAKKNNISPYIIEFINKFPRSLRVDPASVEPGKTIPCQASWSRFDTALKYANIDLKDHLGKKRNNLLYTLLTGFIGVEASIEFCDFIEKYVIAVTADDILNNYKLVKEKAAALSNDRINSLIEQIVAHSNDNKWSVTQGKNASDFCKNINQEMSVHFWSLMAKSSNVDNVITLHKCLDNFIVDIVKEAKDFSRS